MESHMQTLDVLTYMEKSLTSALVEKNIYIHLRILLKQQIYDNFRM